MAPNEKISMRTSAGCPSSCSGRHVRNGAYDGALGGQLGSGRQRTQVEGGGTWLRGDRPRDSRQAEIQQLGALLRQDDVGGLEIAMGDPLAMGAVEAVRNLVGVAQDLVERQRAFSQSLCQRLALQMIHHQEVDVILVA